MKDSHTAFLAGGIAGTSITILMNSYDRAMYLHVANKKPFLHQSNWKNPFHGVSLAIMGRTVSYGFYHSSVDILRNKYKEHNFDPRFESISVGVVTGAFTSITKNPFNVIKYNQWNNYKDPRKSIIGITKHVHKGYSWSWLMRGYGGILTRDCISSTIYIHIRPKIESKMGEMNSMKTFVSSAMAITLGTIASSPFNYAKNMKYHDMHTTHTRSYLEIMKGLINDVVQSDKPFRALAYRLAWGYGVGRVAISVALSQVLYDNLKVYIGQTFDS